MTTKNRDAATSPERRIYESIIKVVVSDPPEKRGREIAEGIGYACALLHDEYGWTAEQITDHLERICDGAEDDYGDE